MPSRMSPYARTRAALAVPAVVLAVTTIAACGGSGSKAATGASVTVTPVALASGAAGRSGGTGAAGFQAYAACLRQHGVTVPTGRPAARPSGARPSGAPRSRGAGFGGVFGGASPTGAAATAMAACASLRPTGGFAGADNAALQSQLAAYRSCLSSHGVTLPTPAARPTGAPASGAPRRGGFGGIGALDTADPKVAGAVTACAALRPSFGQGAPRGSGAPAPTVTPGT